MLWHGERDVRPVVSDDGALPGQLVSLGRTLVASPFAACELRPTEAMEAVLELEGLPPHPNPPDP